MMPLPLLGWLLNRPQEVQILRVDNKRLGVFDRYAEVLPGDHSIAMRGPLIVYSLLYFKTPSDTDSCIVPFHASAGHVYAECIAGGSAPYCWIEDKGTGEIVGGAAPPYR